MLEPTLVDQIKRLLAEGRWSQRKIAWATGVSRGSVAAIASGRRDRFKLVRLQAERAGRPPADDPAGLGPLPTRCPGCGRLIRLPNGAQRCLACAAEEGADIRLAIADEVTPARLDLRGDAAARFARLRRRVLDRHGIIRTAAELLDEDAVAEKQRRAVVGEPLDPREADEGDEEVWDEDSLWPPDEDLAHLD